MASTTWLKDVTDHDFRSSRSGRGGQKQECRAPPVVSLRKPYKKNIGTKIATWNIKTIYEAGKIHNVIQEMQRMSIKILGLSETRWIGSGESQIKNTKTYYSGNNDPNHRNGVAIVVDKSLCQSVTSFTPISDRVVMITVKMSQGLLNIVQVYAPTSDKTEEEVEHFYNEVQQALDSTNNRDTTIIMGDFNSKIGKGEVEDIVGQYGLGQRNERGDRLVEFCQENGLVVTNTFFKLPDRRLYTWRSPADNNNKIIRNQIDYVLVRKRFRNAIKSAKTYPGADAATDHNPVVVKFDLRFKKITQRDNKNQIQRSSLKDPVVKSQLSKKINEEISRSIIDPEEDSNQKWETFKKAIMNPTKEILQKKKNTNKVKSWMTDEILQLMEERRLYKNIDIKKYKDIYNIIRKEIRKAKEEWYTNKCEEIEVLLKRHDDFNLHRKVKELAGIRKTNHSSIILDKEGKIILDNNRKIERWKQYIQELFKDERQMEDIELYNGSETGPSITKQEVIHAVNLAKNNKATGPDEIPAEIIKLITEDQIEILKDLYNTIYDTGIIPKEWLGSTFITLPKKTNARECSDYRTISLMSHTLKIFLKIIHQRIYRKLEQDISNTQFGFRNAMGTREALFAFNVLAQRCMDVNQPMYVCFLDYNKAFDKVRHNRLLQLLRDKNLDMKDIRIISNLYFNQVASVRIGGELSDEMEIQRGVRQGCILSPLLFNLYSEEIIQKALKETSIGIKVNGAPINNIRYADDTLIIAESIEELQVLMDKVVDSSEESGLTLNIKKTKFMTIAKSQQRERLWIRGEIVQKVDRYTYLGTVITENNDCKQEIKSRIGKARSTFDNMRKILCSNDLSLQLKVRMLRCYVFSVLLYGMEAWTLKKDISNRIEAFEMWTYRRILKISWVDRVTNDEVLRKMKKEKEVLNTIKIRKLQYLGHVMRGEKYVLLQIIIQGKIVGKRSIGRRRISWLNNLRQWYNCKSVELFRAAVSKVKIAVMIANLLKGDGT